MTAQELALSRSDAKIPTPSTTRTVTTDTAHDKYGCQVESNHHVTADRFEDVFPY